MDEFRYSSKDFTHTPSLPFCNFPGATLFEYYSDDDLNFDCIWKMKGDYYLVLATHSDYDSVIQKKRLHYFQPRSFHSVSEEYKTLDLKCEPIVDFLIGSGEISESQYLIEDYQYHFDCTVPEEIVTAISIMM